MHKYLIVIKYYYRKTLDLFLQGYFEEGIMKLHNLIAIMTSDIFNKVVKLTETNIFDEDTDSFTLESALDFYLNRKPLKFVDRQCLRHLCDPDHNDDN